MGSLRVRHDWAKSQTQLSDFTFTFHFHALEEEMATHSSVLVWRIPGMGGPGGLPSMGSHRVGQDWSDLAAAAAAKEISHIHFQPHPVPPTWHFFLFYIYGDFWLTSFVLKFNLYSHVWNLKIHIYLEELHYLKNHLSSGNKTFQCKIS